MVLGCPSGRERDRSASMGSSETKCCSGRGQSSGRHGRCAAAVRSGMHTAGHAYLRARKCICWEALRRRARGSPVSPGGVSRLGAAAKANASSVGNVRRMQRMEEEDQGSQRLSLAARWRVPVRKPRSAARTPSQGSRVPMNPASSSGAEAGRFFSQGRAERTVVEGVCGPA